MSKAVLFSIKPKYCELIASGKKTIEVRKTKPKLDTPFKCYIYCTKDFYRAGDGYFQGKYCGKVIGKFVCDEIIEILPDNEIYGTYDISDDEVIASCLVNGDLWNYGIGKTLYGFHISDLVIYDKPKELGEFYNYDTTFNNAFGWAFSEEEKRVYLKRPPQSWCYVEELI